MNSRRSTWDGRLPFSERWILRVGRWTFASAMINGLESGPSTHSQFDLPLAVQSRIHLCAGARDCSVSACARNHRLLRVALFSGARGKPARLRHHRSQQAERRDRLARGIRWLGRGVANAQDGADARFRPEPHGHRRAAQSLVDGCARERPELALRALFRHRMAAAQIRTCTTRCCSRSWAINTGASWSAAS